MTQRIVQITDCHLFADRATELRGVSTWPRLHAVVSAIQDEHSDLDCLVVTGDTAHDEDIVTCAAFREALGELAGRLRILPGNHDDRAALESVFPECCAMQSGRLPFQHVLGDWQIIGLDSQITGEVAGRLGDEQLEWLRDRLASTGGIHSLVFVHHPPVTLRSRWLDAIGLEDASELLAVLGAAPHAKLVCCGHVHQESATSIDGLTVLTTPAVGPQFKPRTDELQIDPLPPAARLLELEPDGWWSTQVIRVPVE